eukprot:c20507_g1_i1 orf=439-735(-)
MTQKANLFKGQQKKSAPANRHGKASVLRKGKFFKQPLKGSKDREISLEVGKFINQAIESKAAAIASKEGARLRLVQVPSEPFQSSKNVKASAPPNKTE